MNPFPILLVAFVAVPVAEIYVLIEVGGRIGVLNTIGLVIATAIIGAALVRSQGLATLARLQDEMNAGQLPGITLLEGALILFAGALLLTPGFITDTIGFLCLLPGSRGWLAARLARSVQVRTLRPTGSPRRRGTGPDRGPGIIDGEYTRDDDRPL